MWNNLEYLNLADTDFQEMPDKALESCDCLASVELSNSLTKIGSRAFYDCPLEKVIIPASVTSLGDHAFAINDINKMRLKEVIINANLTEIPESCFSAQYFLKKVTFPNTLKKISKQAFWDTKIETLDFPPSITSVDATAFYWKDVTKIICRALNVPDMPVPPYSIGIGPFFNLVKGKTTLYVPAASLDAYKDAWGQYFGEENMKAL